MIVAQHSQILLPFLHTSFYPTTIAIPNLTPTYTSGIEAKPHLKASLTCERNTHKFLLLLDTHLKSQSHFSNSNTTIYTTLHTPK